MKRYLLTISYDGSKYYGLAKQPNVITIQEVLETFLTNYFKQKIIIKLASRTDRYVHAIKQNISFDLEKDFILTKKLKESFNQLNKSIKIHKLKEVPLDFHPRYDAKEKLYIYKIYLKNNKFSYINENYQWNYFYKLNDLKALKKASKLFVGKHNFASFTAKEEYKDYVREVTKFKVKKSFNNIYFEIAGTGFLRFQVRNMVGSLMAMDRGKLTYEDIQDMFSNPQKGKNHYKAPGSGLYLYRIKY